MTMEEYEIHIRRVMCIFLAIEAFIVCMLSLDFDARYGNLSMLKYHEITLLETIGFPLIICGIFVGAVLLCWRSKSCYILWEGLHNTLGALLLVISALAGLEAFLVLLPVGLIFCSRMFIYSTLQKRYSRKLNLNNGDKNISES